MTEALRGCPTFAVANLPGCGLCPKVTRKYSVNLLILLNSYQGLDAAADQDQQVAEPTAPIFS